jgi:hypothetical protein
MTVIGGSRKLTIEASDFDGCNFPRILGGLGKEGLEICAQDLDENGNTWVLLCAQK